MVLKVVVVDLLDREQRAQCPMREIGEKTMLKIPALALLAALVVASPASAHRRHYAVAHRGHNSAVVVDPNGLNAFGLVPPGYPLSALLYDPVRNRSYNPALNGGGSAGYNPAKPNID
jgi:hypothetical protein